MSALFGAPLRRVEDRRFLTGRGRYVDDIAAPGALHAAFLRSPHAHARLLSVDAAAARVMPGVRLVLTGDELPDWGTLHVASPLDLETPLREIARPALAQGRVRFVGEAVALVVADTAAAARDAAEAIEAGYDMLPAIADPEAALADGAPLLHDAAPGNLAFLWRRGDADAIAAAFAGAAHVTARRIPNPRVSASPLEPRAAIAAWDGTRFTLTCNGQGVHGMRAAICAAMNLPEAALRVVAPDVGGGFGVKNVAFPEHLCLLHAARLLGAPVRWTATLSEDFAASAHGRGFHATARLALDGEGRCLALEVDAVAEMGAYLSSHGPWCPTQAAGTAMGGCYAIPRIGVTVRGAMTNTAPMEAYRGAGKPEANYIIETLLDAAARETGRDPQALRALNLIAAHPYRTAMGMEIRDGAFPARLAEAARLADRAGFAARRAASEGRGRRRGFGLTCFLETARGAPGEWASLRVHGDGMLDLAVGTQSNGQGHETSFPQLAADLLGLDPARFRYIQADTDAVAEGKGHGGARSLHQGGEAIRLAAGRLLERARTAAARLLQSVPEALCYEGGRFELPDGRSVTLDQIAAEEGLEAAAAHDNALVTFPNGAHAAEVEIDPETGEVRLLSYLAVDDYGAVLNPILAIGSVQGGLAQGIGQALTERIAYDADGAQLLSAGFMDYALPRAEDLPDLRVELRQDAPTAANGLGVKGTGQAGAIAAPQAVMAAIRDALGGRDIAMPATPEAVWRACARPDSR
ncbi:MAG: xanthine dehydrogenase family protein molybdopterin-binding subunit [Acetobacteraceae bacterium]|nr:xanthine dehydrogenase family protein molybdopterin-binding subunit [Acetobacteraceae bacterium]